MEAKIKEVNDYFVQKILNGDFEVIEFDVYTVQVTIDSKYYFKIWIATEWQNMRMYGNSFVVSFMDLRFTDIEKQEAYKILSSPFEKELTEEEKEKLEYERLKAKFENK